MMKIWSLAVLLVGLLAPIDATSPQPPACLDRDGQPMDRWLLLKAPTSYTYYSYEANIVNPPNWVKADNQLDQDTSGRLMRTVQQAYGADPSTVSVLMYSDEPLGVSVSSKYAHAKGVLVTDGNQGFWVTHSMPQWPASPSGGNAAPGEFPSATYGQSLECITVSASTANTIAAALRLNKVYIYYSQAASSTPLLPDLAALIARTPAPADLTYSIAPITTLRGLPYTLFSKAPSNTIDIYDDLVAPFYQTALRVETWRNGAGGRMGSIGRGGLAAGQQAASGDGGKVTQQYSVFEVHAVTMPDGAKWTGTQDHSKWAAAVQDDTGAYAPNSLAQFVTCIGDLNRMCSQEGRGGGALCQTDQQVWNAFNLAIASVEPLEDTAAACAGDLEGQATCYWCKAGYTQQPSARPTLQPVAAYSSPRPSVDPFQVLSLAPTLAPVSQPTIRPQAPVSPTPTPRPTPRQRARPKSSPTRAPSRAGGVGDGTTSSAAAAASSSNPDPFAHYHNLVFIEMTCVSIALAFLLCLARASLPARVAPTPDTLAFTIVQFSYLDLVTTIPLSIMTAVANFIQVSALYTDAQSAGSTTVTIDRAVAGGMVAVRVLVALVSVYLVDSSVRRSVWKQFVLVEYLQFPLLWVVVVLVVLVDPSQVRLLPFMKSPFSEHSGGYPNLHVFGVCMGCTVASSMGIFTLSAASMAFIPLQECLLSTVLTGLWFLLSATLTLVRVARPVDVDELIDSGSMASFPRKYDIYSREGGSEYSDGGAVFGMAAGGGYPGLPYPHPHSRSNSHSSSLAHATERNSLRNSLTSYPPNAAPPTGPHQYRAEVEMRLSGSRLATQPIRRPTPPKRASLGTVLDNIPEPALTLSEARVPSRVASYGPGGEEDEDGEGGEGAERAEGGVGGLVPEYGDGGEEDGGVEGEGGVRGARHVMLDFESGIAEDGGDGAEEEEERHIPQRRPFA